MLVTGRLLMLTTSSLERRASFGLGLSIPASAEELFLITLLIATPSMPGAGLIAMIAKMRNRIQMIMRGFLMICVNTFILPCPLLRQDTISKDRRSVSMC